MSIFQSIFKSIKKFKNQIEQLDLFADFDKEVQRTGTDDEVIAGKTVTKDGKTYAYERSKKNPQVHRLFRQDKELPKLETPDLFAETEDSNPEKEATKPSPKFKFVPNHSDQNEQETDLFGNPTISQGKISLLNKNGKLHLVLNNQSKELGESLILSKENLINETNQFDKKRLDTVNSYIEKVESKIKQLSQTDLRKEDIPKIEESVKENLNGLELWGKSIEEYYKFSDAEPNIKEIGNELRSRFETTLKSAKELTQAQEEQKRAKIQASYQFTSEDRLKAFQKLYEEEGINPEKLNDLVDGYIQSGKMPLTEEIVSALNEKPSILIRKTTADRIKSKIADFIDTFNLKGELVETKPEFIKTNPTEPEIITDAGAEDKQTNEAPTPPKDLYGNQYKLLNSISPKPLHQLEEGDYFKLKSDGFMDFNIEVLYRAPNGDLAVALSHYYKQHGDMMADPDMMVLIDQKNGTVQAATFQQDGAIFRQGDEFGGGYYKEVYPGYPNMDKVDLTQKKEQNQFLTQWLKNIKEQGHKLLINKETEQPEPTELFEELPNNKIREGADKVLIWGAEGFTGGEANRRKHREEINKQVYEILKKSDDEISVADKIILAQYSGKGGTDEVSLNEYYSTTGQANFMWQMLEKFGFKGGRIVEPSSGPGVFLHTAPGNALITAVELSPVSARIAKLLHGKTHDIINKSYEEYYTDSNGEKVDGVIGNAPFGGRGISAGYDPELSDLKNAEQYFIERGIDQLKPGGVMAMIVNIGIMENGSFASWRAGINKKAEFLGAIRMPMGAFSHSHAQVTTDIVFFRKRPEDVSNLFMKLGHQEGKKLYDSGVMNADFVSGNYFEKNPELALGEKSTGNFGRTAQKGHLNYEELHAAGELLKGEAPDYSELVDYGINVSNLEENSPKVGDVISQNGRRYRFNENHRWERADDQSSQTDLFLSDREKEAIEKLGMKPDEFLRLKENLIEEGIEVSHEVRMIIGGQGAQIIDDELKEFSTVPVTLREKLECAIAIGMTIKHFKMRGNRERSQYDAALSERIKGALINFVEKFGLPDDLRKYAGRGKQNALIHFLGTIDKTGKVSSDVLDSYATPTSSRKSYNFSNVEDIVKYNEDNRQKGLSLVEILDAYQGEKSRIEIAREIVQNDNIAIDSEQLFRPVYEVLAGEVNDKLEKWESYCQTIENQLRQEDISDEEREILHGVKEKLQRQIIESKSRAGYKGIPDLPIKMKDAREEMFDISLLNEYLEESILGLSSSIEVDKSGKFNFIDPEFAFGYDLFYAKSSEDPSKKKKKSKNDGSDVFSLEDALEEARDQAEEKEQMKRDKSELDKFLRKYYKDPNDSSKFLTNPLELVLMNYLNGARITLTDQYGDETKSKLKELEDGFRDFLDLKEESPEIAAKYNRKFNNWMDKTFSDSVIEDIDKIDFDKELIRDGKEPLKIRDAIAPNQWESIRRMLDQGKGMLAHGVGVGKTFQAIAIALKMKQEGNSKRPLIVTPKSVLLNWEDEINKWTKDTNILIVGYKKNARGEWAEEKPSEKLMKLYDIINNGDQYDMILMTRDIFDGINFRKETKKQVITELVRKYVSIDRTKLTKKEKKDVDKKIQQLEQMFTEAMQSETNSYQGITFEDLGIDLIIRDEAHDSKSLLKPMLQDDVKGVSSGKISNRAMNNYIATKLIRNSNNDKNVFLLTATPISNSPVEIFNMILPFAESELEKIGIKNMDDFIDRFARTEELPTVDADGRVLNMKKFAGWSSGDVLRKIFFRFVDYKTHKDVRGVTVKFPMETPNHVFTTPNEGQQLLLDHCRNRLWACRVLSRSKMKTLIGQKVKITDKLVKSLEKNFFDDPNPLDEAIKAGAIDKKEELEIRAHFKEYVSTFLSLNRNPDPQATLNTDGFFKIQTDMLKATGDLDWYRTDRSDYGLKIDESFIQSHPDNQKLQILTDTVQAAHQSGEKQLIFAVNKNLHYKIKEMLVSAGIPAEEIVIVNGDEVKESDERLKISKEFNSGKYKVVIGNYATMGEGLNFQNGTSKIHHLQTTWNHLPVQQGNGRGIRQGNPRDSVDTYYYLAKGSVDSFMNQKILDKRNMVDSFVRGEGDWEDDIYMDSDQMIIETARNPEQAAKLLELQRATRTRVQDAKLKEKQLHALARYFRNKKAMSLIKDSESQVFKHIAKDNGTIEEFLLSTGSELAGHLGSSKPPIIDVSHNLVIPINSMVEIGNELYQIIGTDKKGDVKILMDNHIKTYSSKEVAKSINDGIWKIPSDSTKKMTDKLRSFDRYQQLIEYLSLFSEGDLTPEQKMIVEAKVKNILSDPKHPDHKWTKFLCRTKEINSDNVITTEYTLFDKSEFEYNNRAREKQGNQKYEVVLPYDTEVRDYVSNMTYDEFKKTPIADKFRINYSAIDYYKTVFLEKNRKTAKLDHTPVSTKKDLMDLYISGNPFFKAKSKNDKERMNKKINDIQSDIKDGFYQRYAQLLKEGLLPQIGFQLKGTRVLKYGGWYGDVWTKADSDSLKDPHLIDDDVLSKLEFIDYHLGSDLTDRLKKLINK
ncbi:MAG: DEAD/DEAH box helicase family protein [Bacteroidetes bacterium]|nr:DEAD/DEAH box helicase family protein [Bacteroidota bacterium]